MNKFAKSLLLSLVIAAPVSLSIASVQAEAAVLGNTATTTTDVSANTSNGEQYTVAYVYHRAGRHPHRNGRHPHRNGHYPHRIGRYPHRIGRYPHRIGRHPHRIGRHHR